MTKLKLNLLGKFAINYILVVVTALIIFFVAYAGHESARDLNHEIQQVHIPTLLFLKDFETLLSESQASDKNIPEIVAKYGALKREYNNNLADYLSEDEKLQEMLSLFAAMLVSHQQLITLTNSENFDTDQLIQISADFAKDKISKQVSQLKTMLESLIQAQERKVSSVVAERDGADSVLVVLVILLLLTFTFGFLLCFFQLKFKILEPLTKLRHAITAISKGQSITTKNLKTGEDEIGIMAGALFNLAKDLKERTSFAVQIGNGNYNNILKLRSDDDEMSRALLEMRENLKQNAEEERQRNWAVSGLAKFAEIIRNQNDLKHLGDIVIAEMVKYTNSNQGALFTVEGDDGEDQYLKMIACYAWDKKRFVDKEIRLGEGLTGECWQEGDPVFVTQVPQGYVNITSGLGHATPGCVFIAPLKINDKIYGILELATFKPYEEYEREFIIKVSENIASAIFNAKIGEQTQKLLELSQQQAEEMRASEEELRQNMEELQATQEAAERRNQELERANAQAEAQKQTMTKLLEKLREKEKESQKQTEALRAQEEELRQNMEELLATQEAAEKRSQELERTNAQAEAQKQAMAKMVQKLREKEKENQKQTEALRAQEEELRQNMEELQATQEAAERKNLELERANTQANAQRQAMEKVVQKLQQKEKENKAQVEELRAQEEELRQNLEELNAIQEDMEKTRKTEAENSVKVEKQVMDELVAKLRTAEEEVKRLKSLTSGQN